MKPQYLLPVLLLFIAACASAPGMKRPALRSATPEAWTAGATTQAPGDTLWWTRFGDARLDSLIREAITHNFNLQATAARLRAAAAQAKIAGAPLYPQIGAGFGASRRKQNFIGLPIPGSGGVLSSTTNSFGVSIDLSWEGDLWGRLGAGKAAATADYQAARADLRGARLSLSAQTARAWFAAIEARRQVALAQASVENYQTSLEQVRTRYERGLRPSLDLRLTASNLAIAKDLLQQRKQRYDSVLRQLELLLGRYPGAMLTPGVSLPPVPEEVPAGLPADLVGRRPDLVGAERRLAASYARLKQARRALYPRISLTASGGTASNDLNDLLKGDFSVWNIVGNIVQPLFQGGRLRGGIDLARSQSDQALALYAQSVLAAFADVERALSAERFLAHRQEALEEATEQALAARRLAEERYAGGLTDLITMLDAQRRAYDAESRLLSVRRLRLDARIDLHLALGGGFLNRTEILSAVPHSPDQGVEVQ